MTINLARLTDENGVPVGRRYLLDHGWSENQIDMFAFIWGNMTISVGVILVILLIYE